MKVKYISGMKKILISILTLSLLSGFLAAQDVQFSVSVPGAVATGDQFRLTFSVNAKPAAFDPPDLRDFNILGGPSTSSSSSMQIVNGKVSRSYSYSYTYYLQAYKVGTFTIGSASVTVEGKKYSTEPKKIEVIKGEPSAKQSQSQSQGQNQQETASVPANSENLFAAVNVNRKSVYQGEQIIASIKVYTQLDLAGFQNMDYPSFKGFFTQDIESSNQISLHKENVNGKIYNVGTIKQYILFPQQAGEITIEPYTADCIIRKRVGGQHSIFDDFFGSSYQNVVQKAESKPVHIRVKPLPGNAPEDFGGAVGSFKMNASVDRTELPENDAVTLKVTITGNGNIALVEAPKINFPPSFEAYDPKVSSNIHNSISGSTGTKTFDYIVIPRHQGKYRIAPVTFSYFDPAEGIYRNLNSNEFNINVKKGQGENSSGVSSFSKEDVKLIGSDIQYIKTGNIVLREKGETLFTHPLFYLAYVFALVIFIILVIVRRKKIQENRNVALLRHRKATKFARKRLKKAAGYMKANDARHFYSEVLQATWGYLSDKLSIPVSSLSRDTARQVLTDHGADEENINTFMELIDTCEFAQYAPAQEASGMDKIYEDAVRILGKIDQKIK